MVTQSITPQVWGLPGLVGPEETIWIPWSWSWPWLHGEEAGWASSSSGPDAGTSWTPGYREAHKGSRYAVADEDRDRLTSVPTHSGGSQLTLQLGGSRPCLGWWDAEGTVCPLWCRGACSGGRLDSAGSNGLPAKGSMGCLLLGGGICRNSGADMSCASLGVGSCGLHEDYVSL